MHILHVLSIIAPRYGGPACELARLAAKAADQGHQVTVLGLTTGEEASEIKASRWYSGRRNLELVQLQRRVPMRWHFCLNAHRTLASLVARADVVHAHMIWDYLVLRTAQTVKAHKKPLVISPHGTFNERWRYSAFHKWLYGKLFFTTLFSIPRCYLALTPTEARALRTVGYGGPLEVIPGGITQRSLTRQETEPLLRMFGLHTIPFILFLGRLSPEKNVDGLLIAWAKVAERFPEVRLVIAGHYDHDYGHKLKNIAAKMVKPNRVQFIGYAEPAMRDALLSAALGLVLASHSEGLSGSVLQALAFGIPVVATKACGVDQTVIEQCGVVCDTTPQSIATSLQTLLLATRDQRLTMREAAFGAVEARYSEVRQDAALEALYRRLVHPAI